MTSLPRIACFHGGGSNGRILEVQCARLQRVLEKEFEFIYFDAPFDTSPGPGVLPFFDSYAPFKSWVKPGGTETELRTGSGYDDTGRDGIGRVMKMMDDNKRFANADWAGALGFSQGTRVVGGLLRVQRLRKEMKLPQDFDLRFGVLCMGGGAPLHSGEAHGMLESSVSGSSHQQNYVLIAAIVTQQVGSGSHGPTDNPDSLSIQLPTIHVHGLKDKNLARGREQMAEYYSTSASTLYEIDYHHAMPWVQSEIDHLANLIRSAFKTSMPCMKP